LSLADLEGIEKEKTFMILPTKQEIYPARSRAAVPQARGYEGV